MELAAITAKQVAVLFILILTGFVSVKAGIIKEGAKKAFTDFLIALVMPAMVINSYMAEFDSEIFRDLIQTFILSTIILLMGILITMLLTLRIKGKRNTPIIRFACIFSNAAYMGFPLIQALFGDVGLMYASSFVTMFNILVWTVGYALVSGKVAPKEIAKSIVTTPVLWSVAIGLVIYLCRINIPDLIAEPIELIGDMNTPLSMIVTGMLVAEIKPGKLFKNFDIFRVLLIRMLIIPAAGFLLFGILGVSGMPAKIALLLEACPCAAITSVFAVRFNHDEELAAGSVVLSTFLSILTLPLCAMIITKIM